MSKEDIMNKTVQFPGAVRFLSLLLALAMVLSMVPPTHVHATEVTIETFNAAGEACTEFLVGEPILVSASSTESGDKITFSALGNASVLYTMAVADANKSNIYSATAGDGVDASKFVPAGQYVLSAYSLPEAQVIVTVKEPESKETSLEVKKDSLVAGEKLEYKAVSYNDGAWVAFYEGKKTVNMGEADFKDKSVFWFYQAGDNGAWYDHAIMAPGEYSLVLFKDSNYTPDKVVNITVTGEEKKIITTDKTEYAMGEPIMVTVNADYNLGSLDWVGLSYRNKVPNGSSVTSFYYYYPAKSGRTYNLLLGTAQHANTMQPGEYTVYFLANDGYSVIASTNIYIGEAAEVRRETIKATCEQGGCTRIYYTDGTTKDIDATTKLGHDWNKPTYNGAGEKTHTATCKNGCGKTQTNDCAFDAGVATKEPTDTENGVMTYTCEDCGGTYTQEITNKEIKSEVVTKEATCEEHGTKRVTYVDDTFIDFPVQKLGHSYGEWTYDAANKKHTKTCANDIKGDGKLDHVLEESCTFTDTLKDGTITYTCEVCKGGYSEVAKLYADQKVYEYTDNLAINVTVNCELEDEGAWVGIYKKGETPGNGSHLSIYWYYVNEAPKTMNILETRDEHNRSITAGDYVIYLFPSGEDYTPVATYTVTVTAKEVSREEVKATCESDGYLKITYSDGSEKYTYYPALRHSYGSKLSFIEASRTHAYVCENDSKHIKNEEKCTFGEGVVITEAQGDKPGVKEFTCSVCGGKYQEAFYNKEIKTEGVHVAPGCTTQGIYRYTYVDGTYLDVPMPQIGHNYPDTWTADGETGRHIKVCENDATHVLKENCSYGDGVLAGSEVTYTCSVCGGKKVTGVLHTEKDEYLLGEDIDVLAYCTNDSSWVGLYRRDEAPGEIVSMYWFYVTNKSSGIDRSGVLQNMINPGYLNTQRPDGLTAGEYSILLFKNESYTSCIAVKEITILEGDMKSTYDFTVNGKEVENGDHIDFKDGETIKVKAKAEGFVGLSWVGIYSNHLTLDVDFSGITSDYWFYVKDHNGKDVNVSWSMGIAPGNYTIVIFADGGYTRPMKYITFSIDKEKLNSEIITEPTCTNYGVEFVTYGDGTTAYLPVPPLGHLYESDKFTYDEQKHTHTQLCGRCNKVITERCKLDKGVVVEEATESKPGTKKFTCQVCGNSFLEKYELETERPTDVGRAFGENRFETAFAIADKMKENLGVEKFSTIILANGAEFADALSGSYLANQKKAPILLTWKQEQNQMAVDYIKANLVEGGKVYILGGTKAIPAEMESMLAGFDVKRLAGENRFDTNLLILQEAGVSGGELIVCTGRNFADALSASAVNIPILLVNKSLYDNQKEFLRNTSLKKIYIIGGQNAINYEIESQLRAKAATMRIGGTHRYATSVKIAETFFDSQLTAVVAYGLNFPDGLCGGPLAYSMGAPLVLAQDRFLDTTVGYMADHEITSGVVLGGTNLITNKEIRSIFQMAPENPIVEFKN